MLTWKYVRHIFHSLTYFYNVIKMLEMEYSLEVECKQETQKYAFHLKHTYGRRVSTVCLFDYKKHL